MHNTYFNKHRTSSKRINNIITKNDFVALHIGPVLYSRCGKNNFLFGKVFNFTTEYFETQDMLESDFFVYQILIKTTLYKLNFIKILNPFLPTSD